MQPLRWRRFVLALWAGACAASASHAQERSWYGSTTLSYAQVSARADGAYTVTFGATGPLRGLVTVQLWEQPDGTVAGRWALKVQYMEDVLPPRGVIDGPADHREHAEEAKTVDLGTMGGRVTSATLRFDGTGRLAAIVDARLEATRGSLGFAGIRGTAVLGAQGLGDPTASTGTLETRFEIGGAR